MLRGYVNREWDRLQGVGPEGAAELELEEALRNPPRSRGVVVDLEDSRPAPIEDQREYARRILGVDPDAEFTVIQRAYLRLVKRSDPANFPEASDERRHATEINLRVEKAYRILTSDIDDTQKRFGSLEIE
jgi:hypothetical protein